MTSKYNYYNSRIWHNEAHTDLVRSSRFPRKKYSFSLIIKSKISRSLAFYPMLLEILFLASDSRALKRLIREATGRNCTLLLTVLFKLCHSVKSLLTLSKWVTPIGLEDLA